jgi:nucleoprotein TPR
LHEISQKASVERHNLERLLRDRQIEVEACKKEIEMQKMEKDHLEKRLGEVLMLEQLFLFLPCIYIL